MLFAFAVLATAMTQLSDIATAVEANTMPPCPDFCVTGTVAYALHFDGNMCQILVEAGDIGVVATAANDSFPLPALGDRIRLEGTLVRLDQGGVSPEYHRIETFGHTTPPAPREGTAAEIMSGRHDFHRAILIGEVRDIEPSGTSPNWNYLSIISEGHQYYVPIPTCGASLRQIEPLIGSTVRLDGFPDLQNSSHRFLDERRFVVSGFSNIEVLRPPPDDPFANAPSVESLRRLSSEVLPRLGRHKARGRLIAKWQAVHALLQMSDGRKALITFSSPSNLPRGASVEVIGYPSTDGFFLRLSRSIVRRIADERFSEPEVYDLDKRILENHLSDDFSGKTRLQGKRIRLCGTIADFGEGQRASRTLPLAIAGRLLDVDFSSAPESCNGIVPGCKVRVTGTCVLATENWASLSTGTTLSGIRLVVDRMDDVEILASPPWWTPARLAAVVAALLLLLAAMFVWNRQLRRLSEKRGRELFRERTASAIAELKTSERTRLAAEIHDSISQILTGAAMQLDAGETGAAKRILASCRRELRCCLWDLRSHALDAADFASAVRETLAPHLGGRKAMIDLDMPSSNMSEAMRHAALCIIREAAVNAIRHGHADTIAISGELDGRRLSFMVVDNGRGFDPSSCRGSSDGHFGLLGIRERVKTFNGTFGITSAPGNGTEITVVLEDKTDTAGDQATT